jgi:hypothetical protein
MPGGGGEGEPWTEELSSEPRASLFHNFLVSRRSPTLRSCSVDHAYGQEISNASCFVFSCFSVLSKPYLSRAANERNARPFAHTSTFSTEFA